VVLEKRIPLGGGLGGGSSDAAATLLALNRLASTDGFVSDAVLAEMGASLGSDVPFFLQIALNNAYSIAWVSGRGELVQPLALPPQVQSLSLVLVNPGFPSDTASAFRLLDEYREWGVGKRKGKREWGAGSLVRILSDAPRDWPFTNDFLPVFEAGFVQNRPNSWAFSAYRGIFSALSELGADFSGLSGSGSTCFGVFSSQSKARTARELLLKRWNFAIETFLLAFKTIQ
jgi:4-diphosphocytidyl-2-C-methyl-D-erythritol kinase